jgi:hypothetical protein
MPAKAGRVDARRTATAAMPPVHDKARANRGRAEIATHCGQFDEADTAGLLGLRLRSAVPASLCHARAASLAVLPQHQYSLPFVTIQAHRRWYSALENPVVPNNQKPGIKTGGAAKQIQKGTHPGDCPPRHPRTAERLSRDTVDTRRIAH